MRKSAHYAFALLLSTPIAISLKLDPSLTTLFILVSVFSSGIPDLLEKGKGKKHRRTLHSKILCITFLIIFFLSLEKNPLISSFFLGYSSHLILDSLSGKTPWI